MATDTDPASLRILSASPRRIAIVIATLGAGGAERVALNLAEEFTRQRISVDLVVVAPTGELLQQVSPSVRLVTLGGGRARGSVVKLRAYLKQSKPDAVLSVAFHVNIMAVLACLGLRPRSRLIVSVHGTFSRAVGTHGVFKRSWLTLATRLLYTHADGVVAVSEGAARDLSQATGLDCRRIATIYNPVIRSNFDALAAELPSHPWAQDNGSPLIVAAGRLTGAKDYPTLLRAFAKVRRQEDSRLLILGEGELRSKLETMIVDLGLEHAVQMPGYVANPLCYMRAADLFVLSSRWEGLPTVLIEAMATGTPVVSTDCPSGPREILEDGAWGRLVPVGDADALAEAMIQSLRGGGPDGRNRARDFAVEPIAAQYLSLLRG